MAAHLGAGNSQVMQNLLLTRTGRRDRQPSGLDLQPELGQLWPSLVAIYPAWQDYRERTNREFRAFHLTPVSCTHN